MNLSDFGLIGLAVMGENLVLNMERNGYTVAVYNRTLDKVDKFVSGRGKNKNFIGAHTIEEFIDSLERPRKVMMLVKAGPAVDAIFHQAEECRRLSGVDPFDDAVVDRESTCHLGADLQMA